MRKIAVIAVIAAILLAVFLAGNNGKSTVIGGADVPTGIYVQE